MTNVMVSDATPNADVIAAALVRLGVNAVVVPAGDLARWAPGVSADALHGGNGAYVGTVDGRSLIQSVDSTHRVEVLYLDGVGDLRSAIPVAVIDAPPRNHPDSAALNDIVRNSSAIVGSQWSRVTQLVLCGELH